MRIAFLFKKDSHFKAVKSTALRVCAQYNCESTFVGVDSQFVFDDETYPVTYIDKERLNVLSEYDYVIACLGGYLLNRVIVTLRETSTKVISIFPGIVSHYQLDAFISRLNADQVWLNSKSDSELYSKICKLLNCPNNSILYGMSWLDSNKAINKSAFQVDDNQAIIFEQTEILSDISIRKRFISTLEKILLLNPKVEFKYKIRNNATDDYFLQLRKHLAQFENVKVIEDLDHNDIARAKYYLSISSSALIEGMVYGKSSYIIDKGLLDIDSKEFYNNSNIELIDFDLKGNFICVSKVWFNQRVLLPVDNIDLLSIHKNRVFTFFKNRSYNLIRVFLIKLTFFYPKNAYLFFKKNKIVAIQKSLEYLSM